MHFANLIADIEKDGFEWLARTDNHKGYFVHVMVRRSEAPGDYTISCKAYGKDLYVILSHMYFLAKEANGAETDIMVSDHL